MVHDTTLSFAQNAAEKGNIATVVCTGGTKFKAGITRFGDLIRRRSRCGDGFEFRFAAGLERGAAVCGQGWQSLRIACGVRAGRAGIAIFVSRSIWRHESSASKEPWKNYDTPFEPRNAIERISILIYNLNASGKVLVGRLRI